MVEGASQLSSHMRSINSSSLSDPSIMKEEEEENKNETRRDELLRQQSLKRRRERKSTSNANSSSSLLSTNKKVKRRRDEIEDSSNNRKMNDDNDNQSNQKKKQRRGEVSTEEEEFSNHLTQQLKAHLTHNISNNNEDLNQISHIIKHFRPIISSLISSSSNNQHQIMSLSDAKLIFKKILKDKCEMVKGSGNGQSKKGKDIKFLKWKEV